jgi:RNA-directed DNA polymerase
MTEMTKSSPGAPTSSALDWNDIQWQTVQANVRRLQKRIAKAFREKKHSKAKALQWLLTHSFHAKLLAVKRVTQNKGAKTPGVDQVTWDTPNQKLQAATKLKRRGYKTKPLKRIYIPKKQKGKVRPLSIPAMRCRAMQALYLLALEPISEMMADKHSYGFRPRRGTADAIGQCFNALSRKTSARYILEADIKACFDNISHSWLLKNIPIDKEILAKWLAAGYIDGKEIYDTTLGTPQGGIISPCLLVIVLSGLEDTVHAVIKNKKRDKVHFSIYADDFIITGATQEVLEEKIKPVVEKFLEERGLSLSKEKTVVTHLDEGFDFLGMNIRRYNGGKLIIKPTKANVKVFLADIRRIIKSNPTVKTEDLIYLLNPKIRGWTNYYRHVCSKRTFDYIDKQLFKCLWRWARRRHPNKSSLWCRRKYFRTKENRSWVFYAKVKTKEKSRLVDIFEASKVKIKRHIMIRSEATPYHPQFKDYFVRRSWCKERAPNGAAPIEWKTG